MDQPKIDFTELEKNLDEMSREAREFVRQQPLTAVIGAFLIGFVLAWIFTQTTRRRE